MTEEEELEQIALEMATADNDAAKEQAVKDMQSSADIESKYIASFDPYKEKEDE